MFASFWQLLSAVFVTSALLKLVYKLIEGSSTAAKVANRQLAEQDDGDQLENRQVGRNGLAPVSRIWTRQQLGLAAGLSCSSSGRLADLIYFYQLVHKLSNKLIGLLCSLLDAIEGIESSSGRDSALEQSIAPVRASCRPSNYFHRRYLSRRSLSSLLLDDLEEDPDRDRLEGDWEDLEHH